MLCVYCTQYWKTGKKIVIDQKLLCYDPHHVFSHCCSVLLQLVVLVEYLLDRSQIWSTQEKNKDRRHSGAVSSWAIEEKYFSLWNIQILFFCKSREFLLLYVVWALHQNGKIYEKMFRSRQDSNLRGKIPLDFKSNALTTRPRLLIVLVTLDVYIHLARFYFKKN